MKLSASADAPDKTAAFLEWLRTGGPANGEVAAVFDGSERSVPVFVRAFWTAAQRAAHSLHEVSYRACFKPQLPGFFIDHLTQPGDTVHDPFMGRGTTPLETALRGRVPFGVDINPLSKLLVRPRLAPPRPEAVAARLAEIPLNFGGKVPEDLHAFYHPQTLRDICGLRAYFLAREDAGTLDKVDGWIRMVAVNRLTGHSPGFFSVYTLPPNQATSVKAQIRINERRSQTSPERDVRAIINKKTRSLLRSVIAAGGFPEESASGAQAELFQEASEEPLWEMGRRARLFTASADASTAIASSSVNLVVTSPPFLDVVDYAQDNWLRGWFCGFETKDLEIAIFRKADAWTTFMAGVLREQRRVLRPGGHVAFEVGEVRGGSVRLEKNVLAAGLEAGLEPVCILINDQEFTKTAKCWGVDNRDKPDTKGKGTNTNRIVVFRRG